jgi:putative spermidine/putrescine transport system ATP-binding protein
MSLQLESVTFHYPGTTQGLHELTLQVNTGELVAVIGPSGSGKSTLLKLIAGLTLGHSGVIRLDGEDQSGKPVHARSVGMVFQSYALFPHLNVFDNIAYGLKLRKLPLAERQAKVGELLQIMELVDLADRSVAQLSGGQQQRVALARALAINPRALLLDEPLAALDANIRAQLRDQVRRIQRQFNATTLLITHDQEEALTMADRVAVLRDGRLMQFDTPQNIYESPANKAVAEFVGQSALFQATVVTDGTVDLGFCRLRTATSSRPPGRRVWVLIRPEFCEPDPAPDQINRLPGETRTVRYLGSVCRYDFVVDGADQPFLAQARHPARSAIAIAPEHIRLLDE